MSTTDFSLNVQARDLQGKGASRRLRHTNLVPGVIYGGTAAAQSISIRLNELVKALESEAFYSHVLTLNVDGKSEQVILKALQRHPAKNTPMHADFYRIDATHDITVRVPLHFTNQDTAVGVKQQGGQLSITVSDVEVRTLPANLPEFIEVDLSAAVLDQVLHLSDIKLPKGVKLTQLSHGADSHDLPIASIHLPKGQKADEAEAAE
ncbi:MAG: 50S ribosomal protein L25/general stress protein Ctc [Candidatus Saccharibacteria bacterium]|nr:50S ribosomal protein L25/general stress protein Ctc [Moraxellaceae bacterium]